MSLVIFAISVLVLEILLAKFAPVSPKIASLKQPAKSKAAASGN
jgi:hypothetical protein